ncbi:MAG TPA: hypothetical protein VLJ21_01425 [Candidatus Binatia bacterium]|nr:hypothetical protein [Candidatus Binatia bacterium]
MSTDEQTRKEILQGLVRSEKDVLLKLKEHVEQAKSILWLDGATGKVFIEKKDLSVADNIRAYLVGKYFAHELQLATEGSSNTEELASALRVSVQALAPAIGKLVRDNYISEGGGKYTIIPQMLDKTIHELVATEIPVKKIQKRKKQIVHATSNDEASARALSKEGIIRLKELIEKDGVVLEHVFDYYGSDARLIYPIATEGTKESARQYRATMLYLLMMKYAFGVTELNSAELRRKLIDLGLDQKNLDNLSTTLHGYPSHVVHKKGPKGSTLTAYRLTVPGEMEAIKILKEVGGKHGQKQNT